MLEPLTSAVFAIRLTKLSSVSSLTLCIYDYLLTFSDERAYMWNADFGPGKVVYFAIRYLTLAVMLFINVVTFLPRASSELCLSWIRFHWVIGVIAGALTEIALVLRIYALYNRNRRVQILISVSLAITAISMMSVAVKIIRSEDAMFLNFGPEPDLHMCIPRNLDAAYKAFWIPLIVNELLLVSLAVHKWFSCSEIHDLHASTTKEMVKDSILYFVGTFPFSTLSQLMWTFGGESYIEFPVGLAFTMGSVMSHRLLLNVRKYHYGQSQYPLKVLPLRENKVYGGHF